MDFLSDICIDDHEQIFAGDIITYATSSCHNVFNFSSFQHFCKGEVCDL